MEFVERLNEVLDVKFEELLEQKSNIALAKRNLLAPAYEEFRWEARHLMLTSKLSTKEEFQAKTEQLKHKALNIFNTKVRETEEDNVTQELIGQFNQMAKDDIENDLLEFTAGQQAAADQKENISLEILDNYQLQMDSKMKINTKNLFTIKQLRKIHQEITKSIRE